ncbi:hypothetical protein SCHPADRAFT_1000310 [Schizopora paradoxa]|uniref:F-box domain-containing protein n=1 Tax=Schizopora paradoxa TaxID=27342 RepID=A0A0H2RWX4_9AGAM|nr:hypothetical protein SCHPADRAFT_1000310 [Schizopora paradoxa]
MANKEKKTQKKQNDPLEARRMKRVKLERKKAKAAKELGPDRFSRLPFELLANVLSFTGSGDVLSVARCSRHLCGFLVDFPSCNFIWRQARANTVFPISDPLPNLTESAYASILFDPKVCEQCGTVARKPFSMFSLRLWVCDTGSCLYDWVNQKGYKVPFAAPVQAFPWIVAEMISARAKNNSSTYGFFCRKSDHDRIMREFETASARGVTRTDFIKMHEFDSHKASLIRKKNEEIDLWRKLRIGKEHSIVYRNTTVTREFVTDNNWDFWALLRTPTFRDFYIMKKRSLEEMSRTEIDPLLEVIRKEMEELACREKMRTERDEREGRLRQVEKLYARLQTQGSYPTLPAFSVFKELGVVAMMLNNRKKLASDAKKEMASEGFLSLLTDNISVWIDNQQRTLLKLVGQSNYTHKNDKQPHPLTFCTARFICMKCKDRAAKQFKPISLSFFDLCKHKCADSSKTSSRGWSITNFALDQKAVNVSKALLEMLNLKEEDAQIPELPVNTNILCESCEGMVVMNTLSGLHEHCQRHENMIFHLHADVLTHSLNVGLRDELMSRKKSAEKMRKDKTLGCRHCLKPPATPNLTLEEQEPVHDNLVSDRGTQKAFDFDGMRSHLKTRHGVEFIADEDFFRIPVYQ